MLYNHYSPEKEQFEEIIEPNFTMTVMSMLTLCKLLTAAVCFLFCIWFGRWATQGFDFLQAIEPVFISALPEDDFLVKCHL